MQLMLSCIVQEVLGVVFNEFDTVVFLLGNDSSSVPCDIHTYIHVSVWFSLCFIFFLSTAVVGLLLMPMMPAVIMTHTYETRLILSTYVFE